MNLLKLVRPTIWVGLTLQLPAVFSQQFDVAHYNTFSGFSNGKSVREMSNGFVVFSNQTGQNANGQDCSIVCYDVLGQLVTESFIPNSRLDSFGDATDPFSSAPWSTGYIGTRTSFSGGVAVDTVFLYRFDPFGNISWVTPLLSDTFCYARNTATDNRHIYVTGLVASGDLLDNTCYVLRTDTVGNTDLIHFNQQLESYSVDVDSTGSIYIAGKGYVPFNGRGFLLKLDSMGNQVWYRPQPGIAGNWLGVKCLRNGTVLCMGKKTLLIPGSPPDTNQMYLHAYDMDGNTLWSYSGLKDSGLETYGQFHDAYEDSDTTFIACGPIRQVGWNRALIYRFTTDGDSLWRRDYAHFDNWSGQYPEVPWDIEPTSDGGMILTGETWDPDTVPPYTNSPQHMWVLKLDSVGCLVPGCQFVGINDLVMGLGDALKAYPNPSDGRFTLQLSLPEGLQLAGPLVLQVFDMQGRLVTRNELGRNLEQQLSLDLTHQPAGLYSAHLSDGSRILTGVRLVVQ